MHSSIEDWARGVARLISSASTTLANTGPGLKVNSAVLGLNTAMPVTSPGSRSGVNWMRENFASSERASARVSSVLPVPGTSSSSTCPPASSAASTLSTTSSLPTITREMLPRRLSASALMPFASMFMPS